MTMQKTTFVLAALLIMAGAPQSSVAQSSNESLEEQSYEADRINRKVQPISYWVEAKTLRYRDNPVAGNVLGTLDYGQKIYAYDQYENWVRISKPEAKQQWVNSDFLSNSRVSWASFNRNKPTRSSDITAVRIKDPENRKSRIFAVRLKTAETENAVITTREATSQGSFYRNHFVSCNDQRAVGMRLIGEGNSFLGAQDDIRNYRLDIYDSKQIDDKANKTIETAISAFACKAQAF